MVSTPTLPRVSVRLVLTVVVSTEDDINVRDEESRGTET